MKSNLKKLKEILENKIEHDKNYIDKVVGMLGDLAKQILDLRERLSKLEKKEK